MRYRLMASYLGASYQAAIGPTDRDVTLFAAPPPPEEHGFSPVPGGIWRKYVRVDELDALWESRPIGSYHGEPCLVLDDLGDRLHIVYLGLDERRARQLGYWQVDKGVFEVVVARHEVTDLAEERHEFPISLMLSARPRALSSGGTSAGGAAPGSYQMAAAGPQQPPAGIRPQPSGGLAGMPSAVPGPQGRPPLPGSSQVPSSVPMSSVPMSSVPMSSVPMSSVPMSSVPMPGGLKPGSPQTAAPQAQPAAAVAAWHGSPAGDGNGTWYFQPQAPAAQPAPAQPQMPPAQPPMPPAQPGPLPPIQRPQQQPSPFAQQAQAQAGPVATRSPLSAPPMATPGSSADLVTTGPLPPAPQAPQAHPADQPDQGSSAGGLTAGGALSKLTGAVRGRRAARKPRLAMSAIFADLVDLARIPRSAYAVDDEVTGAMCLFKTDGGYEVFSCAEDARHEVRFFEEEEAAYFYLFGVLAAEALRSGRLSPHQS